MRLNLKMRILDGYGSQRNFAQVLGVSDDWLSRIVLGIKNPNMEEKRLIESKLGIHEDNDDIFANKALYQK